MTVSETNPKGMKMAQRGFPYQRSTTVGLAVVLLLCGLLSGLVKDARATEVRRFANGITAVIHTPEDLLGELMPTVKGEDLTIKTPQGAVTLRGNPADLVPFSVEHVARALASMQGLNTSVDVDVYILPATPARAAGSFARQDAIYLAPGTGPVAEATAAYLTTHEMGHVLSWAFLDNQPQRWDDYRQLRGLDPIRNGPTARHADREREILAEDIRILFGGPDAVGSGGIENHDLTLPGQVAGLRELLAGFFRGRDRGPLLVASSAFPNPCNPLTTIAMAVPAGSAVAAEQAQLRIFDLRGALVRTIRGGHLANDRLTVQWQGRTENGSAAASGRYLYVIQAGQWTARGAVTIVR